MLEVILYPVQGRSVGEGPFNREVDICEWTFEKKRQKLMLQQLHHLHVIQNGTRPDCKAWILPYWRLSQSCGRMRKVLLDGVWVDTLRRWWSDASLRVESRKVSSIGGQRVDKRSFRVFRRLRVWVWHMAATSEPRRGWRNRYVLRLVQYPFM